MKNYSELQKEIAASTVNLAQSMVTKTDAYLNSFNTKAILTFSKEKSRIEEYTEKYFLFLSGLDGEVRALTDLNAALASLLIEADKHMEIDVVVLAEKRLYAFDDFEHDLYNYTSSSEEALLGECATASFLVNNTQKFKEALKKLICANT